MCSIGVLCMCLSSLQLHGNDDAGTDRIMTAHDYRRTQSNLYTASGTNRDHEQELTTERVEQRRAQVFNKSSSKGSSHAAHRH